MPFVVRRQHDRTSSRIVDQWISDAVGQPGILGLQVIIEFM